VSRDHYTKGNGTGVNTAVPRYYAEIDRQGKNISLQPFYTRGRSQRYSFIERSGPRARMDVGSKKKLISWECNPAPSVCTLSLYPLSYIG
jgi:hypothetical protein